ncbi:MAG: hypothetical protein Q612_NSC00063G0002 [Negativicoccus succinicivorans DORA_17_25]|uniref:Uncharacterized protein n=1 Tax=Negativicoccus succinicivorans DORA_17_25 TaxID=1403945 RepID=W1UEE9_9FIRM|nr:MAG: hypothetical protein Q612_NSC00063G0002 [Negativicoccus succinicivorans DORA_17_25]
MKFFDYLLFNYVYSVLFFLKVNKNEKAYHSWYAFLAMPYSDSNTYCLQSLAVYTGLILLIKLYYNLKLLSI